MNVEQRNRVWIDCRRSDPIPAYLIPGELGIYCANRHASAGPRSHKRHPEYAIHHREAVGVRRDELRQRTQCVSRSHCHEMTCKTGAPVRRISVGHRAPTDSARRSNR